MSPQRPNARSINKAKRLLDNLIFDDDSSFDDDLDGAKAYALLGIAEALGDIALSLRQTAPEVVNRCASPAPTTTSSA